MRPAGPALPKLGELGGQLPRATDTLSRPGSAFREGSRGEQTPDPFAAQAKLAGDGSLSQALAGPRLDRFIASIALVSPPLLCACDSVHTAVLSIPLDLLPRALLLRYAQRLIRFFTRGECRRSAAHFGSGCAPAWSASLWQRGWCSLERGIFDTWQAGMPTSQQGLQLLPQVLTQVRSVSDLGHMRQRPFDGISRPIGPLTADDLNGLVPNQRGEKRHLRCDPAAQRVACLCRG